MCDSATLRERKMIPKLCSSEELAPPFSAFSYIDISYGRARATYVPHACVVKLKCLLWQMDWKRYAAHRTWFNKNWTIIFIYPQFSIESYVSLCVCVHVLYTLYAATHYIWRHDGRLAVVLHARTHASQPVSQPASMQARTHLNEHYELDKNESNAHIYELVYNICMSDEQPRNIQRGNKNNINRFEPMNIAGAMSIREINPMNNKVEIGGA